MLKNTFKLHNSKLKDEFQIALPNYIIQTKFLLQY